MEKLSTRPTPNLKLLTYLAKLVIINLCFLSFVSVAAKWPSTKFLVCGVVNPSSEILSSKNAFITLQDAAVLIGSCPDVENKKVKLEIESYLEQVAKHYESKGFNSPPKSAYIDSDKGMVFPVYLFDYPDHETHAFHGGYCSGITSRIFIDSKRAPNDHSTVIKNGKITAKGYRDLAHELFHAVQMNYSSVKRHCGDFGWITEGTAEAVGTDTAIKIKGYKTAVGNDTNPNETTPTYRWYGVAPYTKSLYDDSGIYKNIQEAKGYHRASFWRYLGEAYTARRKNKKASRKEQTPDYRFIHTLFKTTYPGTFAIYNDYKWVGKSLEQTHKLGLADLYGSFVSIFAGYIPERIPPEFKGKVSNNDWVKHLFGPCKAITLAAKSNVIRSESIKLKPISSSCFDVTTQLQNKGEVTIQVESKELDSVLSLIAGIAGTHQTSKARVAVSPRNPELFLGKWNFLVDPNSTTTFIISNADDDPHRTKNLDETLEFSLNHWQSSAGTSANKAAIQKKGQKGTGSAIKEHIEKASNNAFHFSPSTDNASSIARSPDAPRCQNPFYLRSCGPQTSISLWMAPLAVGSLDSVVSDGGMVTQFGTSGMALQEIGIKNPNYLVDLAKASEALPISSINISFPLIDYGYSGSFSNASISVIMSGGENYQAIGPKDVIPGQGIHLPLSGKVTIEKFTPKLAIGTFSGALVDKDDIGMSQDPNLPIKHQLSGNFVISTPWSNDRRSKRILRKTSGAAGIEQLFPGINSIANVDDKRTTTNTGGMSGNNSTVSNSSITNPGCDCSCNYIDSSTTQCKLNCKSLFQACRPEQKMEIPEDATLQQKFENKLREQKFSDILVKSHLRVFQESTELEQKAFLEKGKADKNKVRDMIFKIMDEEMKQQLSQ